MTSPIRLVATDIDGTLIREDGRLSERTLAVMGALPVPLVLVTGRPLRWLQQLYDQLPEPLPSVCANGAIVYDPGADRVLRRDPLSVELLLDVTSRLREAVPDIALAVEVEDGRKFWYEEAWPLRWHDEHQGRRVLTTSPELVSVPAVKLLARSASHDHPDRFSELISRTLGGVAETTHSSSSALVEISAAGVTKAAGLAWLCEQQGVQPHEVIAFGDMPNDIPMLTWAGRSVAMGNAHPAAKKVADEVGPTNDDDGVARRLAELFGI